MKKLLLLAAALPVVMGGCLTDLSTPPGSDIRCTSAEECPSGLVCAIAAGRCVDPDLVNLAPLTVEVLAPGAHPRMSRVAPFDKNEVDFVFNRTPVAFDATIGGTEVTCAPADVDGAAGPVLRCAFSTPDVPDGEVSLEAEAVDELGATVTARVPFVVDTTPPGLVQDLVRVEYEPAAENPRASARVSSATVGTTVRVAIVFDEPVTAPPVITSDNAPFDVVDAPLPALVFEAEHDVDGSHGDGAQSFTVTAVDDVGNAATVESTATWVMDATPPAAPLVDDDALITLRRVPWGEPSIDGLVPPNVVVKGDVDGDAATPADVKHVRALSLGNVVGGVDASEDGSFDMTLLVADAREVLLVAYDDAGNPAEPALVKNVEWVASLGGKVPGSTFENPHSASVVRRLEPAIFGEPLEELSDPGALFASDGAYAEATFGRSWRQVLVSSPLARTDAVFVWDAARGRVVTFGGQLELQGAGDTWELVDDVWRERVVPSPPTRSAAMGAYDPVRDRVVMFGGFSGGAVNETWEYDGTQWVQRFIEGPPARGFGNMAYDVDAGAVVLFGGRVGNTRFNDTWTYDGETWTEITPPTSPPARADAGMAWDDENRRIVLVGGQGEGRNLIDTWAFHDGAWEQLGDAPLSISRIPIAFDPVGRGVIMLVAEGQFNEETFEFVELEGDTWRLEGSSWVLVPRLRGALPPDRDGHLMTTDYARNRVILHAGRVQDAFGTGFTPKFKDTWEWDGDSWRQVAPSSTSPREVAPAAFAYDPFRKELVSFGGALVISAATITGDVSVFDGRVWRTPTTTREPAASIDAGLVPFNGRLHVLTRSESAPLRWNGSDWELPFMPAPPLGDLHAAIDPTTGQILVVGGSDADGARETRRLNGFTWELVCDARVADLCPGTIPLVTDPVRGVVVGFDQSGTWEWDGAAWSIVDATGPAPRNNTTMSWNEQRDTVMLFENAGGALGTWEYDGAWHQVPVAALPSARAESSLAIHDETGQIVLSGGSVGGRTVGETWVLDGPGRPALVFRAVFAAAGAGGAALRSVTLKATAGASGPDGDGLEVLAWSRGAFLPVATSAASRLAPVALEETLTGDALVGLPFGADDSLFFALAPVSEDARAEVVSAVDVDDVAVIVRYRLP